MVRLVTDQTYLHDLRREYEASPIWDYIKYDSEGDLWINSLRVMDAVSMYGTPLEIHDMTIMKRRASFWRDKIAEIAHETGYTGEFNFYYASKANMSSPYVVNAYRYGWLAETSSAQDLVHLLHLYQKGLISQELPIICNGFKFPVSTSDTSEFMSDTITFDDPKSPQLSLPTLYCEYIVKLFNLGFQIMPILDSGELDYFSSQIRHQVMDVGLRLKFGLVQDDEHLARSVSRHGMTWDEVNDSAERISHSESLQFKMLHLMVSAAEVVPVDDLVISLLYGVEKYFELKKIYPSLQYLNVGGGIPPVFSRYDYDTYLHRLLSGIVRMARQYDCSVPTLVFEFGSFLAEESGFLVHKVLQRKNNSLDLDEGHMKWAVIDGGLMAALPDMFITHKRFPVLAANNAYEKSAEFILGDLTCDSDGRYPSKKSVPPYVILPDAEEQVLVFASTGAYQKMLGGAGGAHHCGILNPAQLIIEEEGGALHGRFIPAQTSQDYAENLGYGLLSHTSVKARKSWWHVF